MAKDRLKSTNPQDGAWAIIQCLDTGKFLFAKRSAAANNGGFWNFFGGRIDPGEEPRTALVRELQEEAGLHIKQKQLIKLCRVPGVKAGPSRERDMHYFLLRLDREISPRLNREHSNFRWFKRNGLPEKFNLPTTVAIKQGLLSKLKA
jgi:8-oxo-dGTP diphosphatase